MKSAFTAAYQDDGTDNECEHCDTKSILTDYVKRQGWHLAKTYVDDGYSGTNFQRPSFQKADKLRDYKRFIRLGRNYLDCGLYLEFFPRA